MTTSKPPDHLILEKHIEALRRGFHRWPEMGFLPPALGDLRWTPELILATWVQAETGAAPANGLEYRIGNSGGGFDRLDFKSRPPPNGSRPRLRSTPPSPSTAAPTIPGSRSRFRGTARACRTGR